MTDIEDYLLTAFGEDCIERVSPMLRSNYSDAYNDAWKFYKRLASRADELARDLVVDRLGSPPIFRIIHSIHSRPQIARLSGHEVMIYDQHLGQILSMLTRMVSEEAHVYRVIAYIYKLLGQRCYVAGRYDRAAIFSLVANDLLEHARYRGVLNTAPVNQHSRLLSIFMQERFVIAHELAHVALRRSPRLRQISAQLYGDSARKDVGQLWVPSFKRDTERDQFLADFAAVWGQASPASEPNYYPVAAWADDYDKSVFLEWLDHDDRFLDEFLCDSLAGAYLLQVMGLSARGYLHSFSYSSQALLNLGVIQRLDAELVGDDGLPTFAKWADIRASVGRYVLLRTVVGAMAHQFLSDDDCNYIGQGLQAVDDGFRRFVGTYLNYFFKPGSTESFVRSHPAEEIAALRSAVLPLSEDFPELLYMLGFDSSLRTP